jgi:uncharacterized protein YjbJ (UPF0337 family)
MCNFDQTAAGLLAILISGGEVTGREVQIEIDTDTSYLTREGGTMNADQLKGKWMQFKGELKQQYGKFTDDDLRQIEGNYDKFVGKVQERYGDKKDELMKWADQWHQKSAPEATKAKTH